MSDIKVARRTVLKSAAIGGATAAAGLSATATAALKPIADTLERNEFPTPDFESAVGDKVSITDFDGILQKAKLVEVVDLEFNSAMHTRPAHLRASSKVVRFETDNAHEFDNKMYSVKHKTLGRMDLLLSAVPDEKGVVSLEAVIN